MVTGSISFVGMALGEVEMLIPKCESVRSVSKRAAENALGNSWVRFEGNWFKFIARNRAGFAPRYEETKSES